MAVGYHVRILPQDIDVFAPSGTQLYALLSAHHALQSACCGGRGVCGKCYVEVTANGKTDRLSACKTSVLSDMTVRVPVAKPDILLAGADSRQVPFTPRAGLLAAFDIGTTTLVCCLLDGTSGQTLATRGALNPQSSFGADVITRAEYAMQYGGKALQQAVVQGMNALLNECCASASVSVEQVVRITVVGNSVMQHLLLLRSPAPLVLAPYRPLSCDSVSVRADTLSLLAAPDATVDFLPLIAGFVGADTVGCLLATDPKQMDQPMLLLDVGTNGELVLQHGMRRIACSTAAGPALEGAKIRCGMLGAAGAIDHVSFSDNGLSYTVIGGKRPSGLCGSGLIDAVAALLYAGQLDTSGRLLCDGPLAERLVRLDDNMLAVTIVTGEESQTGEPIVLTQRDIREVQLAKAAISAGIALLAQALGIRVCDIGRVLVAGAFGNYLDAHSACFIGLIPAALKDRITGVGNAACEGARLAALSDTLRTEAEKLASETDYLELATMPDFQSQFVDSLAFPAPCM